MWTCRGAQSLIPRHSRLPILFLTVVVSGHVYAGAQVVFTELAESSWRTLLFWLGPPGLVVAGLALLTLAEPRKAQGNPLAALLAYFRPSAPAQQTIEELSAQQYAKVSPQPVTQPMRH